MGVVDDLVYFGPRLGPLRALRLLARKTGKRFDRARVARELAGPLDDDTLLRHLGLAVDPAARSGQLRRLWGDLAPFHRAAEADRPADELRAAAVTTGRQFLFGRTAHVGWPPRWDWRLDDADPPAGARHDVRSTWELQRLQALLPLARTAERAADPDDREGWAEGWLDGVGDFLEHHPGPHGVAWESALEVGLRLVALAQGLVLLAGSENLAGDLRPFHLLDRSVRWLRADLSLDKVVRGNHLLGELAGLTVAGHLFPLASGRLWDGLDPQDLLEEEILRQFHADGVNVEQSLTYEAFILGFLLVTDHLAAARGRPFAPAVRDRLAEAAGHLAAFTAPDGTLPRIGDCDSGRGADFGEGDPHAPAALLERARGLWGAADPASFQGSGVRHYLKGGHLAARVGDWFLALRGGPFGWGIPGPCSHSHADWFCPVLYLGREPVLVDPGVVLYRGPDRDAERRFSAHSGPAFPAPYGPRPAGTFRWEAIPPEAGLHWERGGGETTIRGEASLGGGGEGLSWQRVFQYNELRAEWTLRDRVTGADLDPLPRTFRFAPGIAVTAASGRAEAVLPSGVRIGIEASPAGAFAVEDGFVAPAYGRRVDAPVLVWRGPAAATFRFRRT